MEAALALSQCLGNLTLSVTFTVVERSHCIAKNGNKNEWKLEEQDAILKAVIFFKHTI